ncbi:29839_t:CDS:2, partial [Gigaspora margarita]
KVEGCFIEEYYKENPVLFLTNVKEVPIEEQKEESLEDLGCTKIITHTINTREATSINQVALPVRHESSLVPAELNAKI